MNEVLAHAGPNGGGIIVFLPFLPVLLGGLFINFALRDRAGRKEARSVRRLQTPREQPLHYVHTALRSTKRAAKPADKDNKERAPLNRPRTLKQV
jgi:hypothetical protein